MAETFALSLGKWRKKAESRLADFLREFTLDVAQEIVERNPVKTGFSRASWYVTLGGAPGSHPQQPAAAAQVNYSGVFATLSATLQNVKPSDTIWLSNNASYIQKLEYGGSKQAPEGMVRITLSRAEVIAAGVLARLKG